jgi:hypothetical protein
VRIRLDYGSEGLEVELTDRHVAALIEATSVFSARSNPRR